MNFKEKLHYCILSSAIRDMWRIDVLCLHTLDLFAKLFNKNNSLCFEDVSDEIKDLVRLGFLEKIIKKDMISLEDQVFLTKFGKERHFSLKELVREEVKRIGRDGVIKIAEKIIKSQKVILAVFSKNISNVSMMLASSKENKEERIFLSIPYLGEDSEDFVGGLRDVFEIVDPDSSFICVNAFAIFLSVQGVEVYFPRAEEKEGAYCYKSDSIFEVKTETYDAHNPPKSFCVFNEKYLEQIVNNISLEN